MIPESAAFLAFAGLLACAFAGMLRSVGTL